MVRCLSATEQRANQGFDLLVWASNQAMWSLFGSIPSSSTVTAMRGIWLKCSAAKAVPAMQIQRHGFRLPMWRRVLFVGAMPTVLNAC